MRESSSIRRVAEAALALATLAAVASAATAVVVPAPPRLATRLAGAAVVVVGHVSRVQPYDLDRVRVIHLTVDRVVKGADRLAGSPGALEIVEMRDRAAAPDLVAAGDYAVGFLSPLHRGSYVDGVLGVGRRWEMPEGRFGVIADRDRTVIGEAGDLVDRLAERSRAPAATAAQRVADQRAWTFDALGARHPALVEDGAAGLADLPGLATGLTPAERARLEKAVRRADLPPRIRARLSLAIGEAHLTALAPVLAALSSDAALVLDAAWSAQSMLGAPPSRDVFERALRDAKPGIRAVAVRAFVAQYPEVAVPRLGPFLAGEKAPEVRIAALEALGSLRGNEESLELIEGAFVGDPELEVRQVAGRVIFERGGEEAAASFARLAFAAAPEGQRHAVALLMALGRPADDPNLERIRETHPDAKVQEILRHGFSDPHH